MGGWVFENWHSSRRHHAQAGGSYTCGMTKEQQKHQEADLVSQIAVLNPHDRMVASLMVQVEIVAQEAVATSAIEGITLGLQEARQAAYRRVVGRWLEQQRAAESGPGS